MSKSTGNYYEKKTKEYLEKKGYKVERPIWTKFNRKDFYGCWDGIAVKKGEKMLWWQTKTERCPKKEKQRLKKWCKENLSKKHHKAVLHVWEKYKGLKEIRLL